MKTVLKTLGIAAAFVAGNAIAQADVGLVNHLAGDVSYTSAGKKASAKAYMKIREPRRRQIRAVLGRPGPRGVFPGRAAGNL
jgi:hypothetical protein